MCQHIMLYIEIKECYQCLIVNIITKVQVLPVLLHALLPVPLPVPLHMEKAKAKVKARAKEKAKVRSVKKLNKQVPHHRVLGVFA